jgi:hypothetical protein
MCITNHSFVPIPRVFSTSRSWVSSAGLIRSFPHQKPSGHGSQMMPKKTATYDSRKKWKPFKHRIQGLLQRLWIHRLRHLGGYTVLWGS